MNFGHRKFQCRKYQADKSSGNVRQINEVSYDGCSTAAETSISAVPTSAGVSTAATSSSPNAAQNVRKITSVTPYLQDLTLGEDYMAASAFASSSINMVQQVDMYHIAITDDDVGLILHMSLRIFITCVQLHMIFLQVVKWRSYWILEQIPASFH